MKIIETKNLRFDYFIEDNKVCGYLFFDKINKKHISRLEMIKCSKLVDVMELAIKLNEDTNDSIKEMANDIVKGIRSYSQL